MSESEQDEPTVQALLKETMATENATKAKLRRSKVFLLQNFK